MITFDTIRRDYPNAKNATDEQILAGMVQLTGKPVSELADYFGYQMPSSDIGKELAAGGDNYLAGMGNIAGALGLDAGKEFADNRKQRADILQSASNAPHSFRDVKLGDPDKGALNYLGALFGSSAPFLAEQAVFSAADLATGGALTPVHAARLAERIGDLGLASRTIGRNADRLVQGGRTAEEAQALARQQFIDSTARSLTGAAVSYPSSLGDVLGNQQEEAGSYNLPVAAAAALPYAALNMLGLEGAVARRGLPLADSFKSRIARGAASGAINALGEGINETGQEVMNQIGRMGVNPDATLFSDDAQNRYLESFVGGAAMGHVTGTTGGLLSKYHPVADSSTAPLLRTPQGSLDLLGTGVNPAEIRQGELDLQGGMMQPYARPADMYAGPMQAQSDPRSMNQPYLPFARRAENTLDVHDATQRLAQQAELGALARLDQQGNPLIATPEQFAQQEQIATTLSNTAPHTTAIDLLVPDSARQPVDALAGLRSTAISKQARGILLNAEEAAALRLPSSVFSNQPGLVIQPQPFAQEQAQAPVLARADGIYGARPQIQPDMFGAPLQGQQNDQAAVSPAPASRVVGNDPNQAALIDQRGNPTYAAEQSAAPDFQAMAQEAAISEGFKLTDKKRPIALAAVQALHEGKIEQEDMQQVMSLLGESKTPRAQRVLEKSIADKAVSDHAVAVAQAQAQAQQTTVQPEVQQAPQIATQPEARVQDAQQVAVQPQVQSAIQIQPEVQTQAQTEQIAPAQEAPAPAAPQVARSLEHADVHDLIDLSGEGSHPNYPGATADDAEAALKKRLLTTRNYNEADTISDYLHAINQYDEHLQKTYKEQKQQRIREQLVREARSRTIDDITPARNPDEHVGTAVQRDDFRNGVEAARSLAETLPNPVMRFIARSLVKHLDNVQVQFVDNNLQHESLPFGEDNAAIADRLKNGSAALTITEPDGRVAILINRDSPIGLHQETLLHELVHAATNGNLDFLNEAQTAHVEAVRQSILQQLQRLGTDDAKFFASVITNPRELLGYGMSSPTFYKMTQDMMLDKGKRSLWQRLVAAVAGALKLPKVYAEALSNVMKPKGAADDRVSARSEIDKIFNHLMALPPVSQEQTAVSNANAAESTAHQSGQDNRLGLRQADAIQSTVAKPAPSLAELPELEGKSKMYNAVRDAVTNIGTKSALLGWMTMRQIGDRFRNVAAFQDYISAQEKMTAKTKQLQAEVGAVDHLFTQFGKDDAAALKVSEVMLNATANSWHPDLEFTHADNKHLDPVMRPEFAKARAEYNALSDLQKKVYQETKAKFARDLAEQTRLISHNIMQQYRATLGDTLTKRDGSKISLDDAAKITDSHERSRLKIDLPTKNERKTLSLMWDDLDNNHETLKQVQGPYFPLMRFGDHVVIAKSDALRSAQTKLDAAKESLHALNLKDETEYTTGEMDAVRKEVSDAQAAVNKLKGDEKHYLVEFYESETEANSRVAQIKTLFQHDPTMEVRRELRIQHFRQLDSAPYGFIKNLEDAISKQVPSADAEKVKAAVRDIYIRAMPERAALKSQIRRIKGSVSGAKVAEMRRAIVSSGLRNSFNLSRMEHGAALNEALNNLRSGETDAEKRLGEEMAKRMVGNMTITPGSSKIVTAMSNLSYVTMLGLSPSFLVMNLSQPWTVSAPIMAARHGWVDSGKALGKATAEVAAAMKHSFDDQKIARFDLDLNHIKDEGERKFLQKLHDKGAIDVTQEHDLGAQASGTSEGWTDKLASWSSVPAHHTEVVNRVATALAAYRLENALDLKNGTSLAEKYAEKIVSETHLDYTVENAPRLMQGNSLGGLGKLVFQFKKYQQGMIYLSFKHMKDGFFAGTSDLSPAERHEARKAFAYLMGAQVAIAGAVGTPLTGVLAGGVAVASLFQDKDKDKEYRLRFYNGLKDHVGEKVADLIMKGVPAALLNIDVSNRAGMGDILNPLKFAQTGASGQSTVANALLSLAGPAASLSANYLQAINDVKSGNYTQAARNVIPRFMQSPLDAYTLANDGALTKNGNRFLRPDDVSAWDIAMKSVGFTTAKLANLTDARVAMDTASHDRIAYRKELISQYARASLVGDDLESIRDRIAAFNERHSGEQGIRIDQGSLIKARQAERKYERELRNGVHVGKQDMQLYRDMF